MITLSFNDNSSTVNASTVSTVSTSKASFDDYVGFISAVISIVFYGCCQVPVKMKIAENDGVFFQWMVVTGILVVGFIVNLIQDNPAFYPIAMVGGFVWTLGNISCLLSIRTIGLGLTSIIWAPIAMLSGWATGRFGLFGLNQQIPGSILLNYLGVSLIITRTIMSCFIKSNQIEDTTKEKDQNDSELDFVALLGSGETVNYGVAQTEKTTSAGESIKDNNNKVLEGEPNSFIESLSKPKLRMMGIASSLFAGICYGVNFVPVTYLQQLPSFSENGLDYVFAHISGSYLTGTAYFFGYCILKAGKPEIDSSIVLPSVLSGILFGIGKAFFFLALSILQETIVFPLCASGPHITSIVWSIFYFKEIRGLKNYLKVIISISFDIAGVTLTSLSN